jgi:endonuclease/exonuclease/phosphatase family metal-dependent hydrolase
MPAADCRLADRASTPLSWLGPIDPNGRARLASWCAAVGPAVFHGDARADVTTADLADIAFVSWNVHVGGGDISRFLQDLSDGRLASGRRRHAVLLLQEALRVGDLPEMTRAAYGAGRLAQASSSDAEIGAIRESTGMSLLYVPSMRDGTSPSEARPGDRGNAILSTLPLTQPAAIELPGVRQRRVAVMATIGVTADAAEVPLSIAAVHFDATTVPSALWLAGAPNMRAVQAKSLTAALPRGALVVGADLNTWMGVDEPAARYLLTFFGNAAPNYGATFKGGPFVPGLLLDYLLFRAPAGWEMHYERVHDRYGSDHHPLVGWFVRT